MLDTERVLALKKVRVAAVSCALSWLIMCASHRPGHGMKMGARSKYSMLDQSEWGRFPYNIFKGCKQFDVWQRLVQSIHDAPQHEYLYLSRPHRTFFFLPLAGSREIQSPEILAG
jgi:hypothetical protein